MTVPRKKAEAPKLRDPSAGEKLTIEAARKRIQGRSERLEVIVENDAPNHIQVGQAHSDTNGFSVQLFDTMGSLSMAWVNHSVLALANQSKKKGCDPDSEGLNTALAFVAAVGPADELEAALAQQMFAAHDLAMSMAVRAKQADTIEILNEYGNIATKMMRTFTAQLDALGKHRRGGAQVVKHYHINAQNSQNVIADTVVTGGAGNGKITDQSYEPGSASPGGPALLGSDASGYGVPVTGIEGQEAMPLARGQRRRAVRQS